MMEVSNISESLRLGLVLLLGVCFISQTITLLLSYYQKGLGRQSVTAIFFELMILFLLVVLGLMFGQVLNAYKISLPFKQNYISLRISTFTVILLLSSVAIYKKGNSGIIFGLIPSLILLPTIENILKEFYPWFFFLALLIILLRSLITSILTTKSINEDISAFSVIHAINTMKTGLLYSEKNGQILIINYQMQDLMMLLTGKIYRDATKFYSFLTSKKPNPNFDKMYLDNQIVCVLPDARSYMFTRLEIILRNKTYIHISASDVSTQMALSKKLEKQNQGLQSKSLQLKKTIDDLYELSHEKELKNIRSRTHNILGQHLSFMLRTIDSDQDVDYEILKTISKGLLSELTTEKKQASYHDQVKNIQAIFSNIGVKIIIVGDFPKEDKKAELLLDIIRESTTNAVRHGFATEIKVKLNKKDKYHQLCISNNGYSPHAKITLGSGLRDMKHKVISQGGNLNIEQRPIFTLNIILPGGE